MPTPIQARTDEQVRVSETAGAIVDLAVKIKGLLDTLPAGGLRDAVEHAVTDILIPTTEAVVTGDAS